MDCRFGLDIFLVLLLEWLTWLPLSLPFPQISHVPATVESSMSMNVKRSLVKNDECVQYHKIRAYARRKCIAPALLLDIDPVLM
jgi:hypothetical protein